MYKGIGRVTQSIDFSFQTRLVLEIKELRGLAQRLVIRIFDRGLNKTVLEYEPESHLLNRPCKLRHFIKIIISTCNKQLTINKRVRNDKKDMKFSDGYALISNCVNKTKC